MLQRMHDSADRQALCPRCGYDQRGITATWQESCPLEATCTECGLVYSCAEVLRPEKFEPQWCVEYCQRGMGKFLRASASTLFRSFLPWRFWSRLQMSHRVRPRRIAIYLCVLLLPFVLVYVAVQTSAALYLRSVMQQSIDQANAQAVLNAAQPPPETDEEVEAALAAQFGEAWLQRMKSDGPEVWLQQFDWWRNHFIRQHEWGKMVVADPVRIDGSAFLSVFEAVFLPAATTSRVSVANSIWGQRFLAPREMWPAIYSHIISTRAPRLSMNIGNWFEMAAAAAACLGFGLLIFILFPLSLVLLPYSRRKAKVRWIHIARITAYGMGIPYVSLILVSLILIADLIMTAMAGPLPFFQPPLLLTALGFIPLCGILWWLFAISRHLKMRHALAVTAVHMFLCFLITAAIAYHGFGIYL